VSNKDKNLIIIDNKFKLPIDEKCDYILRLSPERSDDQNNRIVVMAPSGSGKSTFAANYIDSYKRNIGKMKYFYSVDIMKILQWIG
jgi:polynucleotide 5'-kinase involved in rRNA processing